MIINKSNVRIGRELFFVIRGYSVNDKILEEKYTIFYSKSAEFIWHSRLYVNDIFSFTIMVPGVQRGFTIKTLIYCYAKCPV